MDINENGDKQKKNILREGGKSKMKVDCSKYYHFDGECEDVQKEYLKIVENYIEYYHKRANNCKYTFYIISSIKVILIALVPITQLYSDMEIMKLLSVIASTLVLALESLLGLYKLRDKWFLYRETCNILMSELRTFQVLGNCCSICRDTFEKFVLEIEGRINDEARKWVQTVRRKEEDQSK